MKTYRHADARPDPPEQKPDPPEQRKQRYGRTALLGFSVAGAIALQVLPLIDGLRSPVPFLDLLRELHFSPLPSVLTVYDFPLGSACCS